MAYINMKKSSVQLVFREVQSKTTMRYYYVQLSWLKLKRLITGTFSEGMK